MNSKRLQLVNPKTAHSAVFVFPIHQGINERDNVYEATRRQWTVSPANRGLSAPLGLGVAKGVSHGVFRIDEWKPYQASGKWEFTGTEVTESNELAESDWADVIGAAKGYWQRGQYLIVEFDGNGRFRFQRGSKDRKWRSL
jgi:hypothetical protein